MLFGKRGEAAAGPETIDLRLSFEGGYAVLMGEGVRFRIALANAEAVRKFIDTSPARRVFDAKKTAAIARYMRQGLGFDQIAKIYNEPETEIRSYYNWAREQPAWLENAHYDEGRRLAGLDNVRSAAKIPGGIIRDGVLCSAETGAPIPGILKTLYAGDVSRTLQASGGDVEAAAKALQVDADDLKSWIDRNGELLSALR